MFRAIKLSKDEKGQAMVEFALILPILLLLIMGIIQFGLILNGYVTVSNAAREGARVGIVEESSTDRTIRITTKVTEAFDLSPALSLTTTGNLPDGVASNPKIIDNGFQPGHPLSVTVYGDIEIIVPFLDNIFDSGSLTISRTSIMMMEGFRELETDLETDPETDV